MRTAVNAGTVLLAVLSTGLYSALALGGEESIPPPILEQTTTQPEAIASFGACISDSWLYTYGGHVGRAHQHSVDNLSRGFRRLSLLDKSSWEELPAGPPLQGLAMVNVADSVIRVGGLRARNRAGEDEDLWSTAEVASFNPSSTMRPSILPTL